MVIALNSNDLLTEDEMKIIQELQKNAKENIDTIAKTCGFSRQKVWRIIKQLEDNRKIWGCTAIVDAETQGLHKFMLFLKRSSQPFEKRDIDAIVNGLIGEMYANLKIHIQSTYYLQGEYDWAVIFTAEDINQAIKVRDLLVNKISYAIEKIHLSQIIFTLREQNILNPDSMKLKNIL